MLRALPMWGAQESIWSGEKKPERPVGGTSVILIHYFFFCFMYSSSFISPISFIISLFLHVLDLAGFLEREHVALLTPLCQK